MPSTRSCRLRPASSIMNAKAARCYCVLVRVTAASFVPSGPLNALRFRCRLAVHPPASLSSALFHPRQVCLELRSLLRSFDMPRIRTKEGEGLRANGKRVETYVVHPGPVEG